MTLEEAIKHYAEVAESKEEQVKEGAWEKDSNTEKRCYECAKECRQLVEWLMELKKLKEDDDVKDVFKTCNTCKHLYLKDDDSPCNICCHRYINQYVYDDKREVNADEP